MRKHKIQKLIKKNSGRIVLFVLAVLLAVRLIASQCNLWLCGAFVATVVAYAVLSDYGSD